MLNRVSKAFEIDNAERAGFKHISSDQLVAAMSYYNLSKKRTEDLLPFLNQAMYEYKIDTPLKQAAFLAQISVESKGLKDFTEDAGDTNPNLRGGFYGRGGMHITHDYTYKSATEYFGTPFLDNL